MGRGIRRKLFGKKNHVFGRKSPDGKHLLTSEDDANAACESDYSDSEPEPEQPVKQLSEPALNVPRKGEKSDTTVSTTLTNSESKHSSPDSIHWKTISTSKSHGDSGKDKNDNPCSRSTLTFQSQNSLRVPKSFKSRSFSSAPAAVVVSTHKMATEQQQVTLSTRNGHSNRSLSRSKLSNTADDQKTPVTKPDIIQRKKSPTSVIDFFSDAEFNSFLHRQRKEAISIAKTNDEEEGLLKNGLEEEENCETKEVPHHQDLIKPELGLPKKSPASAVTSTAKPSKSFSRQGCNSGEFCKRTAGPQPNPSSGKTVINSLNKAFFSSCQGLSISAEVNSLANHSNKQENDADVKNTKNAEGVAFSVANTFATMIDTLLKAFNCGIYNSTTEPVGEVFTAKSSPPENQRLLPPQEVLVNNSDDLISLGNITDYTAEWSLAMKIKGKEHSGSRKPNDGVFVANPYTGNVCEEESDYFREYKDQTASVMRGYIKVSTIGY